MLDEVRVAGGAGLDAHAAAVLRAELGERGALDVAQVGDRDDLVLVGVEVLGVELILGEGDFGAAGIAVFLLELAGLVLDDAQLEFHAGEDFLAVGDELHQLVVFVLELLPLESDQLAQAHVHDFGGLDVGEVPAVHQDLAGFLDGGGLVADHVHDLVDDVHRLEEAFQDVGALLRLVQLELRAADHHLVAEVDEVAEDLLEGEGARAALHEGDVVEREAGLERGVLEQGVQHDAGVHALLEADHHADTLAGALVVDIGDAFDLLLFGELRDLLDHLALVHHVGDLGDDDGLMTLLVHLDIGLGAHHDAAAAGLVGLPDAAAAHDDAAGREVRTLDVLHQFVRGDLGIVDVGADGVAAFAQVVRGHVRGHADGDAGRAVQQEQRRLRGKDRRFLEGVVEVQVHVDGVLVHVGEDVLGHLLELGLGVTHGGRRVAVHRTEVALAPHQRVALVPPLAQTDHRVVHAGVAVRVVLTHHVTHDTGGFLGLTGIFDSHLVHSVEHAALHRLEAVPGIREGAGHDDGHRIVDVRGAHLVVDLHRLDQPRRLGLLHRILLFVVIHVFSPIYKHANIAFFLDSSKTDKMSGSGFPHDC